MGERGWLWATKQSFLPVSRNIPEVYKLCTRKQDKSPNTYLLLGQLILLCIYILDLFEEVNQLKHIKLNCLKE